MFYSVSPSNGTLNSDKDQFKKYVRVSAEDSSITKFVYIYCPLHDCKKIDINKLINENDHRLVGFDESNKNLYWIWGEKSNLGKLITAPLDDFSKRRVS